MRKTTIIAALALPQVAAFYAVRRVWRSVTDQSHEALDGLELAVLEELTTWDAEDDALFPRVLRP